MASSLPFLSQFFSSFDALIYFSVAFFSSQCCRNSARWTARTDFLLSIFSPGLQSVGLVEARSYSAVDRCSDAHSASLWLVRQLTDSFQMTVGFFNCGSCASVPEREKSLRLCTYVLLALTPGLCCSVLALVMSSYPECSTPQEVMRLGEQARGICSTSIETNIKHKKYGIIKG